MPSIRLGPNAIRKVQSGGGEFFSAPGSWITASYGSGWPIAPVTRPDDVEFPRTIDYPISINATLTPRTGYGLMPFAALKEVYENVTEVGMPVNLLWRELSSFVPRLIDDEENEVDDHPYLWMTESPDRNVPFSVWLTRLIKCSKIYDAAAVFMRRNGSETVGLDYVDGSTLFLIVDEFGNLPKAEPLEDYYQRMKSLEGSESHPPFGKPIEGTPTNLQEYVGALMTRARAGKPLPAKVPAFTQIIKGTPYSWWSTDQIWYMPHSRRMDSPYGESFIERAWSWIMTIVNITSFELAHYRTGTMPEGFVTLPAGMFPNLDRINSFEMAYDMRMGANSPVARSRLRMFPDGAKWIPTKKPDFPAQLYAQAWRNILHAFGVPPSEFGDVPGQGLGGKGFKEGAATDLDRMTLNPHRMFVSSIFNAVLERDGVTDVKFDFDYPLEEIDADKQRQSVFDGMAHGTLSLNDACGQLGLDPIPGSMLKQVDSDGEEEVVPDPSHIANKHLIVAGTSIYVIEDMKVTETGMAIPSLSPKQTNQAGAPPLGPESVAQQDGQEHTPEDTKTLERVLANLREGGTVSGKTYSIPATVGGNGKETVTVNLRRDGDVLKLIPLEPVEEVIDAGFNVRVEVLPPKHDPDGNRGETEGVDLADMVPPDPRLKPEDKKRKEETERKPVFVVGQAEPPKQVKDSLPVGKAESNRLDKHCGVCPEDDDYFGAPIGREIEFDFPDTNHANDVEIVAMMPPGLPPKPALWKPEGGELDVLQTRVGGAQYVREEAAYLLDRSLGFMLVPVAYVAEADGEVGAAIYYTLDSGWPASDLSQYAPEWLEKAAVLDYIMSQTDRHLGHNYLTHPDDPSRLILIDNGLGFPEDESVYCDSLFCQAMAGQILSPEVLIAIKGCLNDTATWRDIARLIGGQAAQKARVCAQRLLDEKMITEESYSITSTPPIDVTDDSTLVVTDLVPAIDVTSDGDTTGLDKAKYTEGGNITAEYRDEHAVLPDGRFPIGDRETAEDAIDLRGSGTTEAERKKIVNAAAEYAPDKAREAREKDKKRKGKS